MRRDRLGWICLLATGLLAGCQTPREKMLSQLGPAGEIVLASIDNLGWSQAGREVRSARFTAIVTTYDEGGKSFTDRQEMEVDFRRDTVTSVGGTPQGPWRAEGSDCGGFHLKAARSVDNEAVKRRMAPTLATLMHRLRGPYNLLGGRERTRTAEPVTVDGQDVVRVGVGGDNRRALAYYFDAATGILKFVTAGADRAGREGTVTVYQYGSLPNGVAFPKDVKVVHIGRNVLVGEEPVFEVEISNVEF